MAVTGLRHCNRHVPGTTLVVEVDGGSNAAGNPGATGDPGDLGYEMPADCTIYVNNDTPLTTYPADKFGPIVGFLDEMRNVLGFADPIVGIVWGVPGSSAASWISTHFDAAAAIYGTSGRPRSRLLVHGANDASGSEATALAYAASLLSMVGRSRLVVGHGHSVVIAELSVADPVVEFPYAHLVLAGQRSTVATCQGTVLLPTNDVAIGPDSHYTALGQILLGRLWARKVYAERIAA